MQSFYFRVEGHSEDLGMELPSVASAKCEALQYATKLICDQGERFWESGRFHMTVADDADVILFSLVLIGIDAPAVVVDELASV